MPQKPTRSVDIAWGMAVCVGLIAVWIGLRPWFERVVAASEVAAAQPVCVDPVAVWQARGAVLSCADAWRAGGCNGLQAADALRVGPQGCEVLPQGMPANMRLAVDLPLRLNDASRADLQLLRGIGPQLSAAIVAYRTQHGAFENVQALTAVRGIGPKTVKKLQRYLVVNKKRDER